MHEDGNLRLPRSTGRRYLKNMEEYFEWRAAQQEESPAVKQAEPVAVGVCPDDLAERLLPKTRALIRPLTRKSEERPADQRPNFRSGIFARSIPPFLTRHGLSTRGKPLGGQSSARAGRFLFGPERGSERTALGGRAVARRLGTSAQALSLRYSLRSTRDGSVRAARSAW
jgi:hypothetical protein